MSAKGAGLFPLRVLLRANFVFLFSKFSSVLSSLRTVPLCCSFFLPFSVFFCFFLVFFFSSFMVLFACLLVNAVCFWMRAVDTERMRILEEQALKVVFSSGPGLF